MFQETTFPRGGKLKKVVPEETAKSKKEANYGVRTDHVEKKVKLSKKQRQALKIQQTEEQTDEIPVDRANSLSRFTIAEGMQILGTIKAIASNYLEVSLPGRLTGRIQKNAVSRPYSKLLAKPDEDSETPELKSLFKLGQNICTKVLNIEGKKITLSSDPAELNKDKLHSLLQKGMTICGSVEDVEDHGYTIDLGMSHVRAFLPLEKSKTKFSVGAICNGIIEEVTTTATTSTVILRVLKGNEFGPLKVDEPNLDFISPGTVVPFNLSRVLKNGLEGKIFDTFQSFVNEHYLSEPLHRPSDYTIGLQFEAQLLYVAPLTQHCFLSMNFSKKQLPGDEGVLPVGHIVEEAVCLGRSGAQILFRLNKNAKGAVNIRSITSLISGNFDEKTALMQFSKSTKHRVRVLSYDVVERVYLCTVSEAALSEKYFSVSDVKVGDVVDAKVLQAFDEKKGFVVKVGGVKGSIRGLELAGGDLKKGATVRCRVLSVNEESRSLELTNRKELLKTQSVLSNPNQVTTDSVFTGMIVQICPSFYLVRFFGQVRALMHKTNTGVSEELAPSTLVEGAVLNFKVLSWNNKRIVVKVAASDSLGEAGEHLGTIAKAKIECLHSSGAQIHMKKLNLTGNVPANFFSDFVSIADQVFGAMKEGQKLKVVNLTSKIFSVRDVDWFERNEATLEFQEVQRGTILKAFVKSYEDGIISLVCPLRNFNKKVLIHVRSVLPEASVEDFKVLPDQPIYVRVEGKTVSPKSLLVSARLGDVWNGSPDASADILEKYFHDLNLIRTSLEEKQRPIASLKVGQKVTVTTKEYFDALKVLIVELPDQISGICRNISKGLEPGETAEGTILWIDYARQVVDVTLNPIAMKQVTVKTQKNPENLELKRYKGYVTLVRDDVVIATIGEGRPLVHICPRFHTNDFQPTVITNLSIYGKCSVQLLRVAEGRVIGMFEENFKHCQEFSRIFERRFPKRKREESESEPGSLLRIKPEEEAEEPKKKRARKEKAKGVTAEEITAFLRENQMDGASDLFSKKNKKKKALGKVPLKSTKAEFVTVQVVQNKKLLVKPKAEPVKAVRDEPVASRSLPGASNFWSAAKPEPKEDPEDEAGEPSEEFKGVKRLKLDSAPESAMDFDRKLALQPENYRLWHQYIKFHCASFEIDKARGVCKRALQALPYRQEKDKTKIWNELLQLEMEHGTKESFLKVMKEAELCNNPLEVYGHALPLLVKAEKKTILEELLANMMKKYKPHLKMWLIAAETNLLLGNTDEVQKLFDRAFKSLDKKSHIEFSTRFAILNNQHDQKEYAQSIFENLLTSFPARTDIWIQYANMLIKDKLYDIVRIVYDRAVVQKIQPKRLQALFREYVSFEERFGTEENANKIRALAEELASKKTS